MASTSLQVHRVEARAFPVNAYIIEGAEGSIVVDSFLTITDAQMLRARVDALGKPLLGILITHVHPDHYGGLSALVGDDRVPIFATEGVATIIRRDDDAKEAILRPMFGDEWPRRRTFPSDIVPDDGTLTLGDVTVRVKDLGRGESPHDSMWLLESGGPPRAFAGDLAYNRMHAYLADGFYESWLANIDWARTSLSRDTVLLVGHGEPVGLDILDWQAGYISTFVEAVKAGDTDDRGADPAAHSAYVTACMKEYLHSETLLFLMQLSIAPVLQQIRSARAAGRR